MTKNYPIHIAQLFPFLHTCNKMVPITSNKKLSKKDDRNILKKIESNTIIFRQGMLKVMR